MVYADTSWLASGRVLSTEGAAGVLGGEVSAGLLSWCRQAEMEKEGSWNSLSKSSGIWGMGFVLWLECRRGASV